MDAEEQGSVMVFVAVLTAEVAAAPITTKRVMAYVIDPSGNGDHLGLRLGGQFTPGGFDLLGGAISARAHPRATVLLESTLTGGSEPTAAPRHYRGWAVWQAGGKLAWRRLTPAEVQAQPELRTGQPFGADPLARFDA